MITIVPEGVHVKEVYLTPKTGLLATDTSGKLFLDRQGNQTSTDVSLTSSLALLLTQNLL